MGLGGSLENERGQGGGDAGTMGLVMAANLSQNELVLQEAYMGVVTDKFPTDWALFNHEGNSNDIHVAGTGEGAWRRQWRSSAVGS